MKEEGIRSLGFIEVVGGRCLAFAFACLPRWGFVIQMLLQVLIQAKKIQSFFLAIHRFCWDEILERDSKIRILQLSGGGTGHGVCPGKKGRPAQRVPFLEEYSNLE